MEQHPQHIFQFLLPYIYIYMKHFKTPLYSLLTTSGNNQKAAAAKACEGPAEAPASSCTFSCFHFYIDCGGPRRHREGSAQSTFPKSSGCEGLRRLREGSAKAQHIRLTSFSLIAKACGRFRGGSAEASSDNYFVQLPSWTSPAPLGLPQCYIYKTLG